MGRGVQNRGRIGIQPYPVNDLQLQGYVPKTLYVPDDISINAAIALGQYNDETRTLKTDENGILYVTNSPVSNGYVGRIIINNEPMIQDNARTYHYDIIIKNVKTYNATISITDASDNTATYNYDINWYYNNTDFFRYNYGGPTFMPPNGTPIYFGPSSPGGVPDHTRLVVTTSTDQTHINISGFIGYLL